MSNCMEASRGRQEHRRDLRRVLRLQDLQSSWLMNAEQGTSKAGFPNERWVAYSKPTGVSWWIHQLAISAQLLVLWTHWNRGAHLALSSLLSQLKLWVQVISQECYPDLMPYATDTHWLIYAGFPKMGVPQHGWFIRGKPIKMDDLGVPLF